MNPDYSLADWVSYRGTLKRRLTLSYEWDTKGVRPQRAFNRVKALRCRYPGCL